MQALDRLTEMAESGDDVDRGALVSVLTDLFLAMKGAQAERLAAVFGDIVLRVLGKLEDSTRLDLAERLGDHEMLPRELALRLAEDDLFDIAKRILECSPVLRTSDLVALAETKPQPHLKALAERVNLSTPVTDVLVRRGTNEVLRAVTDNDTAALSSDSFDALVGKARKDQGLQESLVRRRDLPPDPAKRLIPFLSREIRNRLDQIAGHPRLAKLLSQCMAEEVRAQLRDLGASQTQSEQTIDAVKSGAATLDDAVIAFAKADKPVDLALLLARVGNVAETITTRLVLKGDDAPVILLCRALDISPQAFSHVVKMRARRLRLTGHQAQDSLARFTDMSVEQARRTLAGGRPEAAD